MLHPRTVVPGQSTLRTIQQLNPPPEAFLLHPDFILPEHAEFAKENGAVVIATPIVPIDEIWQIYPLTTSFYAVWMRVVRIDKTEAEDQEGKNE